MKNLEKTMNTRLVPVTSLHRVEHLAIASQCDHMRMSPARKALCLQLHDDGNREELRKCMTPGPYIREGKPPLY